MNNTILIKKKKYFCSNCGKFGHNFKKCNEPITSVGIINIKINNNFKLIKEEIEKIGNENINIINFNNQHINIIQNAHKFENKLQFLLVRRKHNLSYIEFIRGRYEIYDTSYIISLFELMSVVEFGKIRTAVNSSSPFDKLWNELWNITANYDIYKKEYQQSNEKFNYLLTNQDFNLEFIFTNIKPLYEEPEWGFPKGRRNNKEKNIDCAIREFFEETSLTTDHYKLISCISPIDEVFHGTNNVLYKHLYYISLCKLDEELNKNMNNDEIGDIKWFSYKDAINIIRPYHIEKKRILDELYIFFSYIMNNIN
jgi:8-oxo-dGTP pyrophosphatase MutT (NUDIX family)